MESTSTNGDLRSELTAAALWEKCARLERELAEKSALLRTVTETIADAIYVKDLQSRMVYCNSRTLGIIGLPREEVLGRTEHEWGTASREDADAILANDQAIMAAGQPSCIDEEFRGKIYESVKAPIVDERGKVIGLVGVSRDVTQRKMMAEALEKALAEAHRANAEKDRLLAVLSHELRTPLTPVYMIAADNMESPALSAEQREDWEMVHRNIGMQVRLIDDLLELKRLERGAMSLRREPVDTTSALQEVIEIFDEDLRKAGLEICREFRASRGTVMADPVRLRQVFWNVLRNAIKFTPAGGRIYVVTVDSAPGEIRVEIADTGHGMTKEELARVFAAFARGDHASSAEIERFGGLGLGLAISREIVNLHGGRIGAESEGRDKGSRIWITLPLCADAAAGQR